MNATPTKTLANLEAELDAAHAEKRGIIAQLNAVPLRQLTRRNSEYVLLLERLRQLRGRLEQLRLALAGLATAGLN